LAKRLTSDDSDKIHQKNAALIQRSS